MVTNIAKIILQKKLEKTTDIGHCIHFLAIFAIFKQFYHVERTTFPISNKTLLVQSIYSRGTKHKTCWKKELYDLGRVEPGQYQISFNFLPFFSFFHICCPLSLSGPIFSDSPWIFTHKLVFSPSFHWENDSKLWKQGQKNRKNSHHHHHLP